MQRYAHKRIGTLSFCFFIGCFFIVSCSKGSGSKTKAEVSEPFELIRVPTGFPPVQEPENNKYTKTRWALGKKLFYDPILSKDTSISCASCHHQSLAFTDGLIKSEGVHQQAGRRNAPTLANVAYHPYLMREGGVPNLEMQSLAPIGEEKEFGHDIPSIAERLNKIDEYVSLSRAAYNRKPDPFVITRALAVFQRTLLSGNSRYDQFKFQEHLEALSIIELEGMKLFFSDRTNCSSCHNGFDFTDYGFKNNGIHEEYEDVGRYRLTMDKKDLNLFKTPTLRNVELTGPYMHDGSIESLDDVLEHYNVGGKGHPQQSPLIRPLQLSEDEISALKSFLLSLTDRDFIENANFKPD